MEKQGEFLEDQYQPKLKKGINLDVKLKPVKEDEKDGDMDVRVTIKPNDEVKTITIKVNDSESLPVKIGQEISAKYEDRQHRARIKIVDDKSSEVTYEFTDDRLTKKIEKESYEDFNSKVKSGEINLDPDKTHSEYKPDPKTIKTEIKDGVFTLTYDYLPLKEGEKPPSFKASVSMDNGKLMTHVVNGYDLALKHKGSRGVNTAVSSNKDDTHRAHLIADWFRGSAYKEALNIINTSSEYNTGPMKRAEEKIENGIREIVNNNPDKHITFDMLVDAKYYILAKDVTIKAFQAHMQKGEKDQVYDILKNNKDPRKTQSVDYLAHNFKADNISIGAVQVIADAKEDKWI